MKIKIDKNADAIYIYLIEKNNKVKNTVIADEFNKLNWMINFDIHNNWYLLWIEIIPINFCENIKNIKYEILWNNSIKIFFSNDEIKDNYNLYNDKINIWLDNNWNIVDVKIIDIFNLNDFSEKIEILFINN